MGNRWSDRLPPLQLDRLSVCYLDNNNNYTDRIIVNWKQRQEKLEQLLDSTIDSVTNSERIENDDNLAEFRDITISISALTDGIRDCGFQVRNEDEREKLQKLITELRDLHANYSIGAGGRDELYALITRLDHLDF